MSRSIRKTLVVTTLAILAGGCAAGRGASYGWLQGPHAEQGDLQAFLSGYRQDAEGLHLRLTIRNLGDRDALLGGDDGRSPIAVQSGGHRVGGSAYVEKFDPAIEGVADEWIDLVKVDGQLRINAHSSEDVQADIPLRPGAAEAACISLAGRWTSGSAIDLAIPVPGAAVVARTAAAVPRS